MTFRRNRFIRDGDTPSNESLQQDFDGNRTTNVVQATINDDTAIAATIDWHGPFDSREEAIEQTAQNKLDLNEGFYFTMGRSKPFSTTHVKLHAPLWFNRLQYIGASDKKDGGIAKRLGPNHHKLDYVSNKNIKVWLGKFTQPALIMGNENQLPEDLDQCEWLLIQALKPILNERKTKSPPRRRVIIRNRIRGWDADDAKSFVQTMPDIIDFPHNNTQPEDKRPINLYWMSQDGRVKKQKTVYPGPPNQANGRPIGRLVNSLNFLLSIPLSLAIMGYLISGMLDRTEVERFVLKAFGQTSAFVQSKFNGDGAIEDKGRTTIADEETLKELEAAKAEAKRKAAELSEAKARLAEADAEKADLEGRLQALKAESQQVGPAKKILSGLDFPACLQRESGNQPDYLFNITISDTGIRLDKAVSVKHQEDFVLLETGAIPLGTEISESQFRSLASPIYQDSVLRDCRYFVRLYEGEHSDIRTYKSQRQAVESYFYIFRPLS